MSSCPNCNARLTCGCQRRTASDGTQCCSNCVKSKNAQISARVVQRNTASSPTNVKVNYSGPGKQI